MEDRRRMETGRETEKVHLMERVRRGVGGEANVDEGNREKWSRGPVTDRKQWTPEWTTRPSHRREMTTFGRDRKWGLKIYENGEVKESREMSLGHKRKTAHGRRVFIGKEKVG